MKDDLIEIPQFIQHGEEDFTFRNDVIQDVSGILEDNKRLRESPGNGFTDNRSMRHIARIDVVDWYNALQKGYHLEDPDPQIQSKEIRRYLRDIGKDAGLQTVNHLDTPGHTGKIIIK